MASTLYETLNAIEYGRQNCIKNAKLANLPATDNMSIYDLGELFLQQNNTEQIHKKWTRPSDWWDTKTILENAEERDGLYPAYILLLSDDAPTTTFTKSATGKALQFSGILTSDGAWYTEDNSVHTWDTNKDKECSLGYKTRYIIVYFDSKTTQKTVEISKFPCLEFIIGECMIYFVVTSNNTILNLESLDTATISTSSRIYSCNALKNVSLPTLTSINSDQNLYECCSLENVSLPLLRTINGRQVFSSCKSLKSISLPSLTEINEYNVIHNCYSLESISLPSLTAINNYSVISNCYSLESISLPSLTSISYNDSYSTFDNLSNLKEISLPLLKTINNRIYSSTNSGMFNGANSLEKISLPSLINLTNSYFLYNCTSLLEFEFPSTLTTLNVNNIFYYCSSLQNVILPNDWNKTGLNLSNVKMLRRDCILDIFDKLADVTGLEETYTLIIGSENIAKVTIEEIAIATAKGWTIS